MNETTTVGAEFARALAAKDFGRIRSLLAPEIDFRGLTPSRDWQASDPDSVVTDVLQQWFEDSDEIESLEHVDVDSFADRERVGYRFRISNEDGPQVVEQQAYLASSEGRITWMRVVCSGFRPV